MGAIMVDEDRENQLQAHQDGRVYPLGRALRSTYDADNHDTLGTDVTGLMIDLSKVPYDDSDVGFMPRAPQPDAALPPSLPPPPRSWVARLGGWFGVRRPGP